MAARRVIFLPDSMDMAKTWLPANCTCPWIHVERSYLTFRNRYSWALSVLTAESPLAGAWQSRRGSCLLRLVSGSRSLALTGKKQYFWTALAVPLALSFRSSPGHFHAASNSWCWRFSRASQSKSLGNATWKFKHHVHRTDFLCKVLATFPKWETKIHGLSLCQRSGDPGPLSPPLAGVLAARWTAARFFSFLPECHQWGLEDADTVPGFMKLPAKRSSQSLVTYSLRLIGN